MSILFPLGLLALLTLPVIVLLHLMRERRRRVVVPSLLLWRMLPPRQESTRRRRLPLTLLLLLHLLAAGLLGLALARPSWSMSLFPGERRVALVVDTSASMAAVDGLGGGSRLDAARARALAILDGLNERDVVAVIGAGPQARLLAPPGPAGALLPRQTLEGLVAAGVGADVAGALLLAQAALEDEGDAPGEIIVVTDGALPDLPAALAERPLAYPVSWELVGGAGDNRAVVALAARPRGDGSAVQLFARVVNYGGRSHQARISLFGDDRLLDTRSAAIEAGGQSEQTWTLPPGLASVRVAIDGGDGLPGDDSASLSLDAARPIAAVLVSTAPSALERALNAVPGLRLAVVSPADYAAAPPPADLTVFEGNLPGSWPAGGVLVVSPPAGEGLLRVSPGPPSLEEPGLVVAEAALFERLSLGSLDFGPPLEVEQPAWAAVQLWRGESPLMMRGRTGRSELAVWAFDLADSNLAGRLAFPLLVARTVRDLTPAALPASLPAGATLAIRPSPRAEAVEITGPRGGTTRLVADGGGPLAVTLDQPGLYRVVERAGGEEVFSGAVAVNAGAPIESDLARRELPAIPTAPPAPAAAAAEGEGGMALWPWLAAAALLVMVGEWFYVHQRRAGQAGGA